MAAMINMDLYDLKAGKSKDKMYIIMTDTWHKVQNYKRALEASNPKNTNKYRHLKIERAPEYADVYRQNNRNQWTGYNDPWPKRAK